MRGVLWGGPLEHYHCAVDLEAVHAFALWGREGVHSDLAHQGLGLASLVGGEEHCEGGFDFDA